MNRRQFLQLIASGVAGHTLDIDRLLWVPGKKKIFLPSYHGITLSEIVGIELETIIPQIQFLFERDNIFYSEIKVRHNTKIRIIE